MRRALAEAAAAVLALAAVLAATGVAHGGPAPVGQAYVRVDQLGYTPFVPKVAQLMAPRAAAHARFRVVTRSGHVVLSGDAGRRAGTWNRRFPDVYPLDLSALRTPGAYRVEVPALGARSPSFRIAPAASLYRAAARRAVSFFRAQRDGAAAAGGPLGRRPAHLNDAHGTVYAQPTAAQRRSGSFTATGQTADVSGGWSDAGDYLKLVETTSFADTVMLWSERAHPGAVRGLAAEARVGVDWLEHMYDPATGRLLYQVGLGDGNGSRLLGDHDLWRLPQRDDALHAKRGSPAYYIAHRPVFAAGAPGAPLSPNLAGRLAAAFGLCAQVYRASDPAYADRCLTYGEAAYAQAQTSGVGQLLTSAPHSYYPETSWRDDLALGATELYRGLLAAPDRAGFAQSDPVFYLREGARWADAYAAGSGADLDSLNLYDVEALTDYDLAQALAAQPPRFVDALPSDPATLAADLRDQLRIGLQAARRYPFGLANPNTWSDSVTHALGYSVSALLYDRLTNSSAYAAMAQRQLDWALGANPWGSSFIVGTGHVFPRCLQHQVANLAGSLNGRPPLLLGATVGGPTARSELAGSIGAPDGYRRCPASGRDEFAQFNGRGAAYRDDVRSAPTSEPTDDATALALLAFAERLG